MHLNLIMSKWEITYHSCRKFNPISYWVHKGVGEDESAYFECKEFNPSTKKQQPSNIPIATINPQEFKDQIVSPKAIMA